MKALICGKPLETAETRQIEQSGEQSLKNIISRIFPGCNPDNVKEIEVCDGKTTTIFQL